MRQNWPALTLLSIAGIIYGFIGIPWARTYGHSWISITFYAVLVIVALYCRANPQPIHTRFFQRKVRRSPQNL